MTGSSRKYLELGEIASLFGVQYFIIESVLRSPLTVDDIQKEFQYFKSIKHKKDPIIKEQFERFLIRVCFEIK